MGWKPSVKNDWPIHTTDPKLKHGISNSLPQSRHRKSCSVARVVDWNVAIADLLTEKYFDSVGRAPAHFPQKDKCQELTVLLGSLTAAAYLQLKPHYLLVGILKIVLDHVCFAICLQPKFLLQYTSAITPPLG